MTELPSKTFCVLPWVHLSIRPNGYMQVCCKANASGVGPVTDKDHNREIKDVNNVEGKPSNLNVTDFLNSWNNDYMKNTRLQMLAGQEPPNCTRCYDEERGGHKSKRQWETAYWSKRVDVDQLIKTTAEDGSIPPKVSYVDMRLGTKCNLACVMCSPHDSSLWIPEWNAIYPQIQNEGLKKNMGWDNKGKENGASYNWHKNNPKFWEQLWDQIPHMKQLYFAGGEPMIIDEHYEILEQCIRRNYAKDIEIRYNSNGVEWRKDLFELWNHFKHVRFNYSVDAVGERNEYIRYPSKWARNLEAFKQLDEETGDNVEVTIACAVQALNIYYIPEFLRWKLENGFKKINMWPVAAGGISYHFVYYPLHLNVKILPAWFKDEIEIKYEEFISWWEKNWELGVPARLKGRITKEMFDQSDYNVDRLRGLVRFAKSEDWSQRLPEMKEYLEKLDAHRGTNFYKTFPEMKDVFVIV